MRIELLRLRENFDEGFIASLSDFLWSKYQWHGRMYWNKGMVSKLEKNQSAFYANDLLNVIYPSYLPRKKLSPFTREFSYNPGFLCRWLQRIYVFSAVRYPLCFFSISATLIVENAPDDMKDWVFLPGNHSHRIIGLKKKQSMVFIKRGFNASFLATDAEMRRKYAFLPCPKVLDYKSGQNWYVEQQVTGLPVNRLPLASDRAYAFEKANQAMYELYIATQQSITLAIYLEQVECNVQQQIEVIKSAISPEQHEELLLFLGQLRDMILAAMEDSEQLIPLALSHGDFQAANILLDGSTLWLIDWEYAGLRSLYYDSFCLALNSRFSEGLSIRLDSLFEEVQNNQLFDYLPIPVRPGEAVLLWLFLLEEFLLKLTEIATPEIHQKMNAILPWVHQIQAVKVFQENN